MRMPAVGAGFASRMGEEEEQEEEEEESADIERVKKQHLKLDKECEEEMKKGQPKAKRQPTYDGGAPVTCELCGHVVRRDYLHKHRKTKHFRQAQMKKKLPLLLQ